MLDDCSQAALSHLQQQIHDRFALYFTNARVRNLQSVLQDRSGARGYANVEDYCSRLADDPGELRDLVDDLTTKETYFFRIPKHFEALRHHVIPELEQRLSQALRFTSGDTSADCGLRVWSAACATGQEAYSLQITLRESLRYPRAWSPEVWATDLSRSALETMAKGRYPSGGIRGDARAQLDRYLSSSDTTVEIDPDLRRGMRIGRFNLSKLTRGVEAAPMEALDGGIVTLPLEQQFDIIFCRNVLIYFDLEDQQRVISGLERALRPGGYLFTGDAEPLHIYEHGLELHRYDGAIYYRRPMAP